MKYQEDAELSALIKTHAVRYEAPQSLRERISADIGNDEQVEIEHWTTRWLGWRQWAGMGVAFACGVVLSAVVTVLYNAPGQQERLAGQVIDGHVRSLMVAHLSDVVSTDQHTVKPWFSGKLDYSPPVRNLAAEGFALVGGRLDYMDKRPVAALVYRHKLHTINVFVWPVSDKSLSSDGTVSQHGFNVTTWQQEGMQYWAVSDLNVADLNRFAELLRKQPV
jgi:anti-sigma factor RsiW